MPSIRKRPNGRYRARYRDDAGREHARHFARKIDAQNWLDQVAAARVTGQYVDPRAGRITFRRYSEQWLAVQPWRPATRARVTSELARHILPALGDWPLAAIRPSAVQALVSGMSAAPATVRTMYGTVRAIFHAAVRDRLIASNPCERIALPSSPPRPLTVPTVADVRAIAAALPEPYALAPWLGAGLGLRPGELLGLQVQSIDFLRRDVAVVTQLDNRTRTLAPLKTSASYRTVPLPDPLAPMITAHIAATDPRTHGLLFTTDAHAPVSRSTFRKVWANAAAAAGRPGMRLHDMRHAYASALIDAGESVKVVQARLGHASATITLDTYGHLFPASEERTRSAAGAWLSAESPQESAESPQNART